ncbi:MAG: proline--tRNA ligase [Patescibacteria group bacterium]|nr:proline--tRNA ligase [Patescibacteria group bacterium]
MLYSQLFGKTVRDVPKDIKLTSHRLLYQAGYIRELTAGRYELLPLGTKVYEKIISVIQKEMEAIGSQRVVTPTLHPKEIWKKTGRDQVWGKNLLSIKDPRSEQEFTMSATAEGLFSEMVGGFNLTYKDLPIFLHQFSQKFRNEKRPRGGLLRLREFLMKDAYSFDANKESFAKSYKKFYDSYLKIAQDFDLKVIPVEADNGALGGDYSHEFMLEAEFGEDTIVKCDSCAYVANLEKAEFRREEVNKDEEIKPFMTVELPTEVATIKQLVKHYKMPAERFIKNVVYKTSSGKIIIATVTGNLEVNSTKLLRSLKMDEEIEEATDEDLASFGAKSGFVHSWGYKDKQGFGSNKRIIFVADESIVKARNLYGGYKTETTDPINVNYPRDFKADVVFDIASVPNGSKCSHCDKGHLNLVRAIEFGHVFSYGDFYSKAHKSFFIDKDGTKKPILMGAYGIGIERTMAAIIESHHDNKGIVWPESVAPYQVHLISLGEEKLVTIETQKIYETLKTSGIEVLWDDRNEVSAGVKFADCDLIGIPYRAVVSSKTIKEGKIEIKNRNSAKTELLSEEEFLKRVLNRNNRCVTKCVSCQK